jgi:hypothetical protein
MPGWIEKPANPAKFRQTPRAPPGGLLSPGRRVQWFLLARRGGNRRPSDSAGIPGKTVE